MKKILLAVMLIITFTLSGCADFFSELEITFFNMQRIRNIQMDITMADIPDTDPLEFTLYTDGSHQITEEDGEITGYTYLAEDDSLFKLITIDDELYSYQVDSLGDYEFDITVIMELFTLHPNDFELHADGYYRPSVILYDFHDLEFIVQRGYITEMNFSLTMNDDEISFHIEYSNFNEVDFEFPEYTEFTMMEQAIYFLDIEGYIITEYEDEIGFEITIDDYKIYTTPDEIYLTIEKGDVILYYYPETGSVNESVVYGRAYPITDYIEDNPDCILASINMREINNYYLGYMENQTLTLEDTILTGIDTPTE